MLLENKTQKTNQGGIFLLYIIIVSLSCPLSFSCGIHFLTLMTDHYNNNDENTVIKGYTKGAVCRRLYIYIFIFTLLVFPKSLTCPRLHLRPQMQEYLLLMT